MGLLDHLFKSKPAQEDEKMAGSGADGAAESGESAGKAQPDPGSFLHPKNFTLRGAQALPHAPRAAGRAGEKAAAGGVETAGGGMIVLTLGDVLSRIPTQLLRSGMHDENRELRFAIGDLSSDIARGRAAIPLSKIAALCPDIFARAPSVAEDMEIRLPLQKLVEQIPVLRPRPDSAGGASPQSAPPPQHAAPEPAPAKQPQPAHDSASPFGDEQISLALAAILPGCPPEIITGKLPHIEPSARITLPFAPIDRQLAGGRVEVSSRRFVSVLPAALQPFFQAREGVKVVLPLEEILKNIPAPDFAEAEDQTAAPIPLGAPASEAAAEPLAELPTPGEIAAQTPREHSEAPAPFIPPPQVSAPEPPHVKADAEPAAGPVVLKHRAFPVFTPPPPAVGAEKSAPAAGEPALPAAPSVATAPIAPVTAAAPKIPPPPLARPTIIPPPIHTGAVAAAAAPTPPPAPQNRPLPHQDDLRAAIGTRETLTLAALAGQIAALPGVLGCAVLFGGECARAGSIPDAPGDDTLRALASRLETAAGAAALGALASATLRGVEKSLSIFARPGVCVAAVHRELAPAVGARIAAIAEALARTWRVAGSRGK